MQYNRQLTISAAGSRHSTHWQPQVIYWSELVERLRTATRGTETLAQYLAMPKSQQDDLKDVGGFVAGALAGGRRKAGAVTGRDVITLDLDSIPAGGTADVLRRLDALGCAYAVYSTRKHEEAKPRLRALVPTDRTMTADEYEPLARKLAAIIGIELCDPTTFQATRLMYWPSCSADSQYVFTYGDKPFLSADGVLSMYADWRNWQEWPQVPGASQVHVRLAAKQGDPTTKPGVVGAFCRVYDVLQAMETFLPGIYTPADDGRFTYVGGSTTGGAIVYDDGQFLYSHHATDPCGGRLVNAFDLVRLHKFGDQDDEAKPGTPTNRMPSFSAMVTFALQDAGVAAIMAQERYERAVTAFDQQQLPEASEESMDWLKKLELSPTTGRPAKTAHNVLIVLTHDPAVKDKIYRDTFTDRIMGKGLLPWPPRNTSDQTFIWSDADEHGLFLYIERVLGYRTEGAIRSALVYCSEQNAINPVEEYLMSLKWDGVPRLDSLYIDYLGAEDCPFIRTITRKAMVAAVARAVAENVKFDYMTVVCGPQGIGKSTLFRRIGKEWFSDSLKTFEGKEAEELIQGKWIVEIAELQAFNRVDVNRIKQFLSKTDDQYREAYGRNVKNQVRRSIFFGTTNDHEYLHDPTGNRRFWPVDTRPGFATKNVFSDLTNSEIDQIWAEAVMRWRMGEPLYLSAEMEEEAERRRQEHMVRDPLEGIIEDFLEREIPEDWLKWDLERRLMFWGGGMQYDGRLVPRDRICAAEIWRECLQERRTATRADANRINSILAKMAGWDRSGVIRFGAGYGSQRGFMRK
ncbi:virulence-associated E family protein [Paenibacillus woosongensis]|uniref:Virulence-associated E family protein n=1 Tax=Paenibacillus woosongensis TaxID=307580 RepID=A0AA95I6B2_9BACL|nr:virulence-associated E family protein [Paenibacillus woosongensis]WHX50535.1 virulence-associated E family protein [Paenibacillus woosongensis]